MGRGWGPPFAGGVSSFFLGLNRGKRGISIDLKQPEGIELCLRLIDKMDVLIENFRPGSMDRLGLGFDSVHRRNPRLVYCSISGYGQNGPSRDEAAMDLVVQASSGLLSITGTEQGESVRCGYGVTDVTAGLFAVIGILLALRARESTGRGQYVDVSMLDGMISTMSSNYASFLGSGVVPQPMGTSFPTVVPYRVFHTKDRALAIAVGSEKLWSAFCRAIGRPGSREASRLRDERAAHPQSRDAGAASVSGGSLPAPHRLRSGWSDCGRRESPARSSAISRFRFFSRGGIYALFPIPRLSGPGPLSGFRCPFKNPPAAPPRRPLSPPPTQGSHRGFFLNVSFGERRRRGPGFTGEVFFLCLRGGGGGRGFVRFFSPTSLPPPLLPRRPSPPRRAAGGRGGALRRLRSSPSRKSWRKSRRRPGKSKPW